MLERYKTVYRGKGGEIIEKKSRFIATVRLVETEEEALAFIEEMKKNCCLPALSWRGSGDPDHLCGRDPDSGFRKIHGLRE